jgi:mannose-6-phosphate isomerase-like protein (cupin superfamily)
MKPESFLNPQNCMLPVLRSPQDCPVYRISVDDKNRLAIVFDSRIADSSLTVCIEIFEPRGKTPSHRHSFAVEMFFILKGKGLAICDGKNIALKKGDSLLVRPTGIHQIINTGNERLYALCFMIPNEDFSELIRSGTPDKLDQEDLQVIQGFLH